MENVIACLIWMYVPSRHNSSKGKSQNVSKSERNWPSVHSCFYGWHTTAPEYRSKTNLSTYETYGSFLLGKRVSQLGIASCVVEGTLEQQQPIFWLAFTTSPHRRHCSTESHQHTVQGGKGGAILDDLTMSKRQIKRMEISENFERQDGHCQSSSLVRSATIMCWPSLHASLRSMKY